MSKFKQKVWFIEHESPIGFRTIKTGLSIFLCLLAYMILEPLGFTGKSDAFLACITAIICMKDSVDESLHTGGFRLVGTFIGAVCGMAYIYVATAIHQPIADMILMSLCIILVITICNLLNSQEAIIICCVVFLFVAMGQSDAEIGPIVHSAKRFADTAIGLVISFLVNRFLFNPETKPEVLVEEENENIIEDNNGNKKSRSDL